MLSQAGAKPHLLRTNWEARAFELNWAHARSTSSKKVQNLTKKEEKISNRSNLKRRRKKMDIAEEILKDHTKFF